MFNQIKIKMNLKEKQEALYEKWQKERNFPKDYFTKDGILNYDVWKETKSKIMFLLKETADDFVNIANREIDIRDGKGSHFWWNICYWKYVVNKVYNGDNSIEFIDTNELPEAKKGYILNDIAYVNIKKECQNKAKSNDGEIIEYARRDKDLLIEQIDLISPNVIFCNNATFISYKILYGELEAINDNCFIHNNRLIIKYYHPSYFQISGGRETHFYNIRNFLTDNVFEKFNWEK